MRSAICFFCCSISRDTSIFKNINTYDKAYWIGLLLTDGCIKSNGELVLAGRVNQSSEKKFKELIATLKKLPGIRSVKNFVIMTTASTARIDLSNKYQVTGTSKYGTENQYVVINGLILAKGDSLEGMTITDALSDEVQLEKDGLKYKILLLFLIEISKM